MVIRSLLRLIFCRLTPLFVLLVALFIGYLNTTDYAIGTGFALMNRGRKWMGASKPVPEVPADFKLIPPAADQVKFDLPGGYKMPASGIGMCCRPNVYEEEDARRTVLWFLLQGGRLIDTADLYLNHVGVGLGIKDAIARGIPRSEIFVTSKIFPTYFGKNATEARMEKMLKDMQLDYVDLVLLHAPTSWFGLVSREFEYGFYPCKTAVQCWSESWGVLADYRNKKKIRNAGLSNFAIKHMEELKKTGAWEKAPLANMQIQYNPWVHKTFFDIADYVHKQGATVTGWWTFGGDMSKDATLSLEILDKLAKKYKKSTAQILLRWSLDKKVAVIPGTGTPKNMRDNLNVFDFQLTKEEVASIDKFGAGTDMVMTAKRELDF